MSSSRRGSGYWLSAWLPVLFGIGVIVLESTIWFGSDHTSHPLRLVFEALFGRMTDAHWNVIHHYIRKSGHFIGYGLLCLTWLRAWWMVLRTLTFWRCALLGLVCTALVASCDEWHQTFLPNRTGTPWDVLLDCCGGSVALLLVYAYARAFRSQRLARTA
jgi:VanZ family protein